MKQKGQKTQPNSGLKLIAVSEANYEALKKFGEFGESFDDVITKILDMVDEAKT